MVVVLSVLMSGWGILLFEEVDTELGVVFGGGGG